jgi:hypothetical protein
MVLKVFVLVCALFALGLCLPEVNVPKNTVLLEAWDIIRVDFAMNLNPQVVEMMQDKKLFKDEEPDFSDVKDASECQNYPVCSF